MKLEPFTEVANYVAILFCALAGVFSTNSLCRVGYVLVCTGFVIVIAGSKT